MKKRTEKTRARSLQAATGDSYTRCLGIVRSLSGDEERDLDRDVVAFAATLKARELAKHRDHVNFAPSSVVSRSD